MKKKGFTFIDVLVATSLILIVFSGIFGAYQLGLKVVGQSKNRIIATAIANGWMEKIRNLPYQSVGTKGVSLPFASGILDSATTTIFNNVEYQTEIRVKFVVDEADGTGTGDECNWDYKNVEVMVSWSGRFTGKVKLISDIAPKDKIEEIQTCLAQPGGILSVKVFDAYGIMITSPLIEIFSPQTGQLITSATPLNGKHDFPLATSTYKIVVSKSGYNQEETFASGDSYQGKTIVIPEKPNPIVLEGQVTEISFSIDKTGSLTCQARGVQEAGYPIIPNVTFALTGAKKIGLDATENIIYKYSQNHTINGSGQVTINNLEWDFYSFLIITPDLNLTEVESPPGVTTTQPIGLTPNSSSTVRLILSAENSLLVKVEDLETLEPIFSAAVRLFNTALGYDFIQYTDETGQTYFIPLEEANYNLEVEGPGYASTSRAVFVSGNATTTIQLQQIE